MPLRSSTKLRHADKSTLRLYRSRKVRYRQTHPSRGLPCSRANLRQRIRRNLPLLLRDGISHGRSHLRRHIQNFPDECAEFRRIVGKLCRRFDLHISRRLLRPSCRFVRLLWRNRRASLVAESLHFSASVNVHKFTLAERSPRALFANKHPSRPFPIFPRALFRCEPFA